MAFDIYGQPLTPGHCEVHPDVPVPYPCHECLATNQREQDNVMWRRLRELEKRVARLEENVDMQVDPDRPNAPCHQTGIFVRAQDPEGKWINADIGWLDLDSLNYWLRSRGGENEWAESVVRTLLGHR